MSNGTKILTVAAVLSMAVPAAGWAAPDIAHGRQLHDQQCLRCHVQEYGGDGSKMYLRSDRLIQSRVALTQRVEACSAMTNAGWLPDDEADVAAYLNDRYYHFK